MKRTKNNSLFGLFLVALVLLASCGTNNPPSKALDSFAEQEEIDRELIELYFYPSTVRMLDKFISSGEGGILEGVKEGRLFYASSDSSDVIQENMSMLRKDLTAEGFELLAEFRSKGTKTVAFVREKKINRYVVVVGGKEVPSMMVEMKGEISMKTLQGLSTLNSDKVMNLLDIGLNDDLEEIEELEEPDFGEPDTTETNEE